MNNTESLLALVDAAEDLGTEAEYVWASRDREVLLGVKIAGVWVENHELDLDLELAKEADTRYSGDNAEANAYYR